MLNKYDFLILINIFTFFISSCGSNSSLVKEYEASSILTIGGSGSEYGNSIIQTKDGGFVVTGSTNSKDGDFNEMNKGDHDIFVTKFSQNREIQWNKTFGGDGEIISGKSIYQTTDDGFVLTGSTKPPDNHENILIKKLGQTGDIQFTRSIGGSGQDYGQSIIQTTNGDFVLTGQTNSNDGDFEIKQDNLNDIFVMKLTSNGNVQWVRTFGGNSGGQGYSITNTKDEAVVLTGSIKSVDYNGNPDTNITVIKLNSDGDTLWNKTFGGSREESGKTIVRTIDGDYVLTGNTRSNDGDFSDMNRGLTDIFVIKLNSIGDAQWIKTFGGNYGDIPFSITQTTDRGFVLTGGTYSTEGEFRGLIKGSYDIFIMKLSNYGEIQWNKTFGGLGQDWGQSIIQTLNGKIVLTGGTNSNNDDFTGKNKGETDIFIISMDENGEP